jgi:flavin reductase (DIM6/NTAB) family NADH-FMN oxidoreductase RutF
MSIHNPVKRLFMTLTEGVYVIGVGEGGLGNAFTATSLMQASMRPPLLVLAVNPENASYPLIVARGVFSVTVLQRDQIALAGFFGKHSARDENKLRAVRWHAAPSGAPVLDDGLAYFDCRVMANHPAGDHVVLLAEVTGGDFLQQRARPLRYDELGNMDGSDELLPDYLGTSSEIHGARPDTPPGQSGPPLPDRFPEQ